MEIKVVDDFLEPDEFEKIETLISGLMFPWYLSEVIRPVSSFGPIVSLECEKKDNWQFIHLFYSDDRVNSDYFKVLLPILVKIVPRSLVRIKANCVSRTEKSVLHGYHPDFDYKECTTAIFYVNTNNGFTQFKNGEKVLSVANRLVTFPSPTYHSGVSCTDEQVRMVINFNYF
jgi:hypothetical protein